MFISSPYLICFSRLRGVPSTWFVSIPLVVHPLWRIFRLPGLGLFYLAPFLPLSWVHCVLLMIGKCSSTLEGKQAIQKIRKVQKENFPVLYPSIVPNRFWCWIQVFPGWDMPWWYTGSTFKSASSTCDTGPWWGTSVQYSRPASSGTHYHRTEQHRAVWALKCSYREQELLLNPKPFHSI